MIKEQLLSLFADYTFRIVTLGTVILGISSGIIGTFLTLRKQSLLGDALGHASLPGIVIGFMIIQRKSLPFLLLFATFSGLIATFIIKQISTKSPIKLDSALAIVLSSFFGLGTVLLTYIQRNPDSRQAGLDKFIFGQASAMLFNDVRLITVVSVILIILVILFWKEFKLLIFDAVYAQTLDNSFRIIDILLSIMTVTTIVIGLESVGVVLISSLLIAPSIAARQWSNQLRTVVILSGIFGAISCFLGTLFSSIGGAIPTGPSIVIVATIIVLISILFAPKRGLIANLYLRRKKKAKMKALLQ